MWKTDPYRCKIKREKFHFDILWYSGVIKSQGGGRGGGGLGETVIQCLLCISKIRNLLNH